MKKWLLSSTLLFLLCYTQLSYAQKSYYPGSIIKVDGQTIEGFIEVRNWNNTPSEVRFKKKLSEERQVYPASQVQSFQVNDMLPIIRKGKRLYEKTELILVNYLNIFRIVRPYKLPWHR